MKIIDLLNKIANGEEVPKKIAYTNKTYLFEGEISNYVNEYSKYDFLIGEDITAMLNDEVKIIEEIKSIVTKEQF